MWAPAIGAYAGAALATLLFWVRGSPVGTFIRWPENVVVVAAVIAGLQLRRKATAEKSTRGAAVIAWLCFAPPLLAAQYLALVVTDGGYAVIPSFALFSVGLWGLGPDYPFAPGAAIWLFSTLVEFLVVAWIADRWHLRRKPTP